MAEVKRLSAKLNVTLPGRTHAELAALQERLGIKRSGVIVVAVRALALEHRIDCGERAEK